MFIDYITLLLINMAAGFVVLACFFLVGLNSPNRRVWAPAFAAVGAVAFAAGLHMTLTWPVNAPGLRFANVAFGEMSVLLGVLFLGMALAAARGWDPLPLSAYAIFAGLAAIIVGVAIRRFGLTATPRLTAAGFVLSGFAGVMAPIILLLRNRLAARAMMALILIASAGVWSIIGYGSYWKHIRDFSSPGKAQPAATAPAAGSRPSSAPSGTTQPGSDMDSRLRREISGQ
jgi:putative membrane protein